ncbi:hypothetical protein BDW59DRAFT_48457 [Aspergillus cavernicola]|uniref:Uncharacterized protein n=1 Tax=Aspergillus cavernicola TaxID=176166 RepID=A0ABR4J3C5_9EURO
MPIKLPKGFARRKSSGNVLEEVENTPQSSFRVFERPSTGRKSLSDGNIITQRTGDAHHPYPPPEDDDNIFAGSDGPAVRNLTGGNTFEGPTTVRFSSSTRRSTDLQTQFDSQPPHSRNLSDVSVPPLTGALRAAGRTFSFGGRFSKAHNQAPPRPSSPDTTRSRASTATPPKLLETEFQIGRMDDDFGNMFNYIGKHIEEGSAEHSISVAPFNKPSDYSRKEEKAPRPAPISTDRSKEVDPSPYSWGSRHSGEGLLAIIDSPQEESSAFQSNPAHSTPMSPLGARRKSTPMSDAVPVNTTSHRSLDKPKMATDRGLRRSVMFSTKRDTAAIEDEDARLVTASLHSNKRASQAPILPASPISDAEDDVPLFDTKNAIKIMSKRQEFLPVPEATDDNVDASIAAHARLAAEYESKPMPAPSSNKIMTPSQFEHYRQQQELQRASNDVSDSEDSGSEFDEEDEAEKNRETERQRRKQEAHMSVYRQQMMKVTGQQSPSPSLRPEDRATNSTPNLANLSLHPGNPSGSGKSSEGDDDDEVPLGILAAHGFPNRNRPPSRLMSSNSMQNLRASYHQPQLGSAGSDIGSGNRSSLPVFARNLPRDPYLGASLVTPANRESLALGGGSVYGGANPSPSPGLPPGGLVGVIATEERARAMRRGSPNTQAMYDNQPGFMGPTGNMGGIPRPYTMLNMNSHTGPNPQASASEQAQIQLSQQMGHMMQMQMQWMQQMIQLQGGQVPPQQLAVPGLPPFPFPANPNSRPSSMPSAGGALLNAPPGYGGNQRTLSMLDPNVSSQLNSPAAPFASGGNRPGTPGGGGYAPSLAPSERSNVGLAPRYRPVSMLPAEAQSTNFLPLAKPWNDENRRSSVLTPSVNVNPPNTTIRPVSSYSRTLTAPSKLGSQMQPEDEDEDEGWADMMKKREKKRSNWKTKKEPSSFGDLLNAVH